MTSNQSSKRGTADNAKYSKKLRNNNTEKAQTKTKREKTTIALIEGG
jgi:hypothetical protein